MAPPLYKKMRKKGTSFYAFPSAIKDFSLSNFQDNIKISPSKFILLNIPKSSSGDTSEPGVLDFVKATSSGTWGNELYNWDPDGPRSNYNYSESLIEGLRNYVANSDTVYRESKINKNKDFYNPSENKTPVEMLFWKWCKKMNILDLEPAVHKIDWDKNITDFQNPNSSSFTNKDYFRKYLWKEREINEYDCEITSHSYTEIQIDINEIAKFKPNDEIRVSGSIPEELSSGVTYTISDVSFSTEQTTLIVTTNTGITGGSYTDCKVKLDYHKLVQYIGEVQAVSKIKTSENNYTEFTAMIPPHVGQTPTILFETTSNSNYYPGLELPILSEEIQQEIKGAEYLASPIRTNPGDYPGSYFGYFDTVDKTYANSTGDPIRLRGDYYGIEKTHNDGLAADDYIERLTDFNSDNIDGLSIDFNRKHYLKMNLPGSTVKNFDEFSAMSVNDEPPSDFEYNAILWYYDIDDGSGNINTNLYGIEFLNNPDDDFGSNNDGLMTPTRKLVTNKDQDGLSYMYNLNLDFKVDNSMVEMKYDTSSIYNLFGFDLYNNVMANYGKLNKQFSTIIDKFINMNKRISDLETIMFSQIELEEIKSKLKNHEELLKLYQTNQFVNSDTVGIEVDYTKNYPALKFNAKTVEYNEIYNLKTDDIIRYNIDNSDSGATPSISYSSELDQNVGEVKRGSSWMIGVPDKGKTLINIYSNIVNEFDKTASIVLDKDLYFKQSMDILIMPDICSELNSFQINMMFDDGLGKGVKEKVLIEPFDLPIDILTYNENNPTDSTFNNSYYFDVESYVDSSVTGTTTEVDLKEEAFAVGDWVYITGFKFENTSNGEIEDYSGLYKIVDKIGLQIYLNWDTSGKPLKFPGNEDEQVSQPKIFYYKGMKINIMRINDDKTSEMKYRYKVTKEYLDSQNFQKLNN